MKRAPDRDRFPKWMPWAIVIVMVAALVTGYFVTTGATTAKDDKVTAEGERDATAEQALKASLPVVALCREQSAVGDALRAAPDNPCEQAKHVVADPVVQQGPEGKQGPGPTDEQLDAAVARWLVIHPIPAGRGPTVAEITAALAAYLIDNPVEPGRPPSAAEIALEVARWFADHPVRDGVDGKDGERGPGPTQEQIRAEVDAYMVEHPAPAGPNCPEGTTLRPVRFLGGEAGLGCVTDPAPMPTPAPIPLIGG